MPIFGHRDRCHEHDGSTAPTLETWLRRYELVAKIAPAKPGHTARRSIVEHTERLELASSRYLPR